MTCAIPASRSDGDSLSNAITCAFTPRSSRRYECSSFHRDRSRGKVVTSTCTARSGFARPRSPPLSEPARRRKCSHFRRSRLEAFLDHLHLLGGVLVQVLLG